MDVLKQHMRRFPFWSVFRKCVLPEGLANKKITEIVTIPECSDLIDYNWFTNISICKFDAQNTPDEFKHMPDLFGRAQGPENMV